MFKDIRNYITESEFKITCLKDKINVLNYENIDHFSDSKIIIRYQDKIVVVKGEKLIISKLLDDEMLVCGNIKIVEFR